MPHIHGSWGHYVRPGKTDPKKYGSYYEHHVASDAYMADTPEERRAAAKKAAKKVRRRRRKAVRKEAEKAAQSSQQGKATHKPPVVRVSGKQDAKPKAVHASLPEVALYVRDVNGVVVYNCGSKKGARIRSFLLSALPRGSVTETSATTLILRRTIEDLGFNKVDDFKYWCSHRGKQRQ